MAPEHHYKGYCLVVMHNRVRIHRYGSMTPEHETVTLNAAMEWVDREGFPPVSITLPTPNDVRNFLRLMKYVTQTSESSVLTELAQALSKQIPAKLAETVPV